MDNDVEKILYTEDRLREEVHRAAEWLDKRYENKNPLFIAVLKGSVMFFCDLVREMKTPVEIDFMTVSSYGSGTESKGMPKIVMDLATSVEGRDVVLVEDIVDSGRTLASMRELILGRGAKSFTAVTLLSKPSRRAVAINADYTCFEIGDEFIVGYGLDYAQKYRNLPYIAVLKKEAYERSE